MTLREQKIVLTFVSMIQPSDEDFKVYSLAIKDFYKLLNLKGREHYTQIKGIIGKLMTRTIEISKDDGGYLITHWATHVEYISGEGIIQFSFEPKLKPYLLQLKRTFTSYKLSNILSLGSYYSIRIYELLKKWQRVGKWEVSVDHFKSLLGITQKSYNLYGNFKNRVIKPSIEELNNETDLYVTFKEIKKGRQVVKLTFNIRQTKNEGSEIQKVVKKTDELKHDSSSLIEQMNHRAVNYEIDLNVYTSLYTMASNIYNKSNIEDELLGLITLTNKNAKKNPIGFMIHILKSKEEVNKSGGNPSIVDNELKNNSRVEEVIPEWFKNNQVEKIDRKKLEDKEQKELEEMLARHSTI